jgi:hypothetical protein
MFQMIQSILIFLLSLSFSLPAFADWSAWDTLGGTIYSAPSACTAGNWTFVFALNSQHQVSYRKRWLPTGIWSQWRAVPNLIQGDQATYASGAPAVYCLQDTNNTRVALHVVGFDQRIWSTIAVISNSTIDTWYKWNINPGFNAALYSGPAIASLNGSQTHLFARGGDNRIYVQIVGATLFQLLISEQTPDDPAAVWSSNDRLELFYRDNLGQIWHQYKKNNVWYPRQLIPPGETHGSLAVVSRNSTTLDLFTRGPDNSLFYKRFENGVWSNWINMGGQSIFGPGATVYANSTRMMVFLPLKSDGALRYRAWAP